MTKKKLSAHRLKKRERMRQELRDKCLSMVEQIKFANASTQQVEQWADSQGRIHLRRGYNLTGTLEDKIIDASPLCKWTAFVNNTHTLAHLVPLNGGYHIRIPLYKSLKNLPDRTLMHVIMQRVWG
jgi:hypothetical protein